MQLKHSLILSENMEFLNELRNLGNIAEIDVKNLIDMYKAIFSVDPNIVVYFFIPNMVYIIAVSKSLFIFSCDKIKTTVYNAPFTKISIGEETDDATYHLKILDSDKLIFDISSADGIIINSLRTIANEIYIRR